MNFFIRPFLSIRTPLTRQSYGTCTDEKAVVLDMSALRDYNKYTPYINVRCKCFLTFFIKFLMRKKKGEVFMSDSSRKYMSIGEVAKSLGLTRRIILNYEDKGLIQADHRDSATGNRYYSTDVLSGIRAIRVMQNFGLSLDDIYAYYHGTTDLMPLIARLEKLRDELNLNIEKLKERVKSENDFEIQTVTIPAQTVFCKTLRADTVEGRKEDLRSIIPAALRQYGSDTTKRMFFISYSLDDPNLISYCVAVPSGSQGEDVKILPEEKALCIFYHGSYESIPCIRDHIVSYAKEKGLSLKGTCQHIYLEGPPHHTDPEKFITQVVLPLA